MILIAVIHGMNWQLRSNGNRHVVQGIVSALVISVTRLSRDPRVKWRLHTIRGNRQSELTMVTILPHFSILLVREFYVASAG